MPAALLQRLLRKGTDRSFNRTTVDSDTSTSDTVLLFATGQARHGKVHKDDRKALKDFRHKLDEVLLDLALQVVRDGEGAQKLIRVDVAGAVSDKSAHRVAMAVANSPLVKTAVAGEDANWGPHRYGGRENAASPRTGTASQSQSAAPGWPETEQSCRDTMRRRSSPT